MWFQEGTLDFNENFIQKLALFRSDWVNKYNENLSVEKLRTSSILSCSP